MKHPPCDPLDNLVFPLPICPVARVHSIRLSFQLDEIARIVLEGGTQNTESLYLQNGDKLSGVIEPETILVHLIGGQEAEIDKDKIKEIVFGNRNSET